MTLRLQGCKEANPTDSLMKELLFVDENAKKPVN